MRERLIELLSTAGWNLFTDNRCKAEIADHLLANGVIVLPCKIGAELYDVRDFFDENCSHPEIFELKDNELIVFKPSFSEEYEFTYDGIFIDRDDVGKTMFYTREEAEQALKDMRRGDKDG